jgi:hypothetical protein
VPPQADNKCFLDKFLAAQLTAGRIRLWRRIFFVALAIIAVLNVVATNSHPHFVWDAKPLFWPAFGLIVGLALVFLAKKIIQPLIKKSEDYYGDL